MSGKLYNSCGLCNYLPSNLGGPEEAKIEDLRNRCFGTTSNATDSTTSNKYEEALSSFIATTYCPRLKYEDKCNQVPACTFDTTTSRCTHKPNLSSEATSILRENLNKICLPFAKDDCPVSAPGNLLLPCMLTTTDECMNSAIFRL